MVLFTGLPSLCTLGPSIRMGCVTPVQWWRVGEQEVGLANWSVAGPRYRCSIPLTTDRFLFKSTCFDELVCKSCDAILDEPVELICKHLLCCSCCFSLLRSNLHFLPCPTCGFNHQLVTSTFQKPGPLVDKLLQQTVVRCDKECKNAVYLKDLRVHIDTHTRPGTARAYHSTTNTSGVTNQWVMSYRSYWQNPQLSWVSQVVVVM